MLEQFQKKRFCGKSSQLSKAELHYEFSPEPTMAVYRKISELANDDNNIFNFNLFEMSLFRTLAADFCTLGMADWTT